MGTDQGTGGTKGAGAASVGGSVVGVAGNDDSYIAETDLCTVSQYI